MKRSATAPARSIVSRTSSRAAHGVLIAAVVTGVAGSVATAQKPYPIFTLDHLVNTMKTLGPNFAGATASLADNDYETAKERLTRSREQLATTITFWRDNQKDDAIAVLRDTVGKMDDLDAVLSAEMIDAAAVNALAAEIEAACEACHAVYREQDPVTNEYRLKPGSVE